MKTDFIEFEHNRDNRAVEGVRERISLANEWADEIYNTINSDKHLSHSELTALKRRALQYINHLKTIEDPRKRLTLHMEYNQELALSLTKQLERALTVALGRLKSCVDVIDNSNKSELFKTGDKLSYPEKALITAYKEENVRKGDPIYDDWLYYKQRSNRIGTEADRLGSFSKRKTNNKIKRIEKIISYLPLSVQQTAIDELTTLRTNFTKAINTISEI